MNLVDWPAEMQEYKPYMFLEALATIARKYALKCGCNFDEQSFKKLFDEIEAYIYSEEWIVTIAILENFEPEGMEEATINNKYRIRKLNEWEINKLIDLGRANSLGFMVHPHFGILKNIWCIEVTAKNSKTSLDPESSIAELVTLLRLFKRNYVSVATILKYLKTNRIFSDITNISASWKGIQISVPRPTYGLKQEEVDSLSQLLELYNHVKDKLPDQLKLSLRWFNKLYDDLEVEDKILDLDIAFDAMFSGQNYSYYVSSLQRLRDARNDIVHYKSKKLKPFKPNELEAITTETEEVFRKCYKWFLELIDNKKNYEEIVKEAKKLSLQLI